MYISKSNEKSVVILKKYVEASAGVHPISVAIKNKKLENRQQIKIAVTDPREVVEECGKRKLNVVHGPPGCGKTYTGVKLALDRFSSIL